MSPRFHLTLVLAASLIVTTSDSWASQQTRVLRAREHRLPSLAGVEHVPFNGTIERPAFERGLDTTGNVYLAGTTYYDYQHNGTVGKMVAVDNVGYVHVVWMRGADLAWTNRHAFYNIWDAATSAFLLSQGAQIDGADKAGYACLTLLEGETAGGWCFPAFHQQINRIDPNGPHAAAAIDYWPGTGAFTVTMPAFIGTPPLQLIWPKIAVGPDSTIHMVSTEYQSEAGMWSRFYYSRGRPTWDADGYGLMIVWQIVDEENGAQFKLLDTTMTVSPVIAASHQSNRVVIAYTRSRDNMLDPDQRTQFNNDLYLLISEDGGLNWSASRNLTAFVPPDTIQHIEGDTLRAFADCDAIFDVRDEIHVAFSARTYFYYQEGVPDPYSWVGKSGIWHWKESCEEFSPVAISYGWLNDPDTEPINPGSWQLYVHRPSLAVDWQHRRMYCVYQRFMPQQWSEALWPMADIYVSASCNDGRVWSQGVNITETDGGRDTPPPGSRHEREPSVAERVTYEGLTGYLHVFYVFDRDAGSSVFNEGERTLCDADYQRVPIDSVPVWPIMNPFTPTLHADGITGVPRVFPSDTTQDRLCNIPLCGGAVGDPPGRVPEVFTLYPNWPNPFNASTMIQFDLARDAAVTLRVFNVLGQEVATLIREQTLRAGTHVIPFNGSNMASGIYLFRMDAAGQTATRKMVLLK